MSSLTIMACLDHYTQHILVQTRQNYDYELNDIFSDELDLRRPDNYLIAVGENVAATIGNIISHMDPRQEAQSDHESEVK